MKQQENHLPHREDPEKDTDDNAVQTLSAAMGPRFPQGQHSAITDAVLLEEIKDLTDDAARHGGSSLTHAAQQTARSGNLELAKKQLKEIAQAPQPITATPLAVDHVTEDDGMPTLVVNSSGVLTVERAESVVAANNNKVAPVAQNPVVQKSVVQKAAQPDAEIAAQPVTAAALHDLAETITTAIDPDDTTPAHALLDDTLIAPVSVATIAPQTHVNVRTPTVAPTPVAPSVPYVAPQIFDTQPLQQAAPQPVPHTSDQAPVETEFHDETALFTALPESSAPQRPVDIAQNTTTAVPHLNAQPDPTNPAPEKVFAETTPNFQQELSDVHVRVLAEDEHWDNFWLQMMPQPVLRPMASPVAVMAPPVQSATAPLIQNQPLAPTVTAKPVFGISMPAAPIMEQTAPDVLPYAPAAVVTLAPQPVFAPAAPKPVPTMIVELPTGLIVMALARDNSQSLLPVPPQTIDTTPALSFAWQDLHKHFDY